MFMNMIILRVVNLGILNKDFKLQHLYSVCFLLNRKDCKQDATERTLRRRGCGTN